MVRALLDTNILIDYLAAFEQAQAEVERYPVSAISVVTWVEVMVGVLPANEKSVRAFLTNFELLPISPAIAEQTVVLRRERRLKLPDAVILATAMVGNWLLVTRNTRDFEEQAGLVRIPYRV